MNAESRKNRRARVQSMSVRYRTATFGDFVEQACRDVSIGGTFVETTSPLPPGTLLRLELLFASEKRAMPGIGRVVWSRGEGLHNTASPPGMGIKFIKMDPGSAPAIARLNEVE